MTPAAQREAARLEYAPRPRTLGARAAETQQQVDDLEAANAQLTRELQDTKNKLQLSEERCAVAQTDALKAKIEAERDNERIIEVETLLDSAATLLLKCMELRRRRKESAATAAAHEQETVKAVEHALLPETELK